MKRILISLVIGVVILALVIQTSNIADLSKKIESASPSLVIVSFTIIVCFIVVRSVRWKIIIGKGRFLNLFSILQIGNLLANILPAHLQEPIRAVLLKEKENIGIGHGLSSIVLERLMDVVGLLSIGIITSLLFPTISNGQPWIFQLIRDIIIIATLATAFLIFFVLKPNLFSKIFGSFKKYPRLQTLYLKSEILIIELSSGFKEMAKKPANMIYAFLITILMWGINFLAVYILFLSIGFHINPLIILFGFVGATLGMALPQSPGYIGTFEIIWLGAFSTLGYVQGDILAVGLLYHLLILVYSSILGIVGVFTLRLSIRDIFNYKMKNNST